MGGLPDISASYARIFMDGGKQIAIPNGDNGKFIFYNLEVGEHSLEVHLNGFEFANYLIDVRNDGKIRSYLHNKRNEPLPPKLIIMPLRMAKYVPDAKPWNPFNFLKSGPGIMMAIMLVTTVILPKMMESMGDPQQMMEEQATNQQPQQQSVSNQGGSKKKRKK